MSNLSTHIVLSLEIIGFVLLFGFAAFTAIAAALPEKFFKGPLSRLEQLDEWPQAEAGGHLPAWPKQLLETLVQNRLPEIKNDFTTEIARLEAAGPNDTDPGALNEFLKTFDESLESSKGAEIAETVRNFLETVLRAFDSGGDAVAVSIIAILSKYIHPGILVLGLFTSLAIEANEARDSAGIRLMLKTIYAQADATAQAQFLHAYDELRSSWNGNYDYNLMRSAFKDLNKVILSWLIQLEARVKDAPEPNENGFWGPKRSLEFDRYIREAFEPIHGYLEKSMFALCLVAIELRIVPELLMHLKRNQERLVASKDALKQRRVKASIQSETNYDSAKIYAWLEKQCAHQANILALMTLLSTQAPRLSITSLRDRMRYLAVRLQTTLSPSSGHIFRS